MKVLTVKCPHCGVINNLGEKALKTYNSSLAFSLNRKCTGCENIFDETDTSEADYGVGEQKTVFTFGSEEIEFT